jgi:hypothetical protein
MATVLEDFFSLGYRSLFNEQKGLLTIVNHSTVV